MMSNGPCSSRRSFHSGDALDRRRVDLLGRAQHVDVAEALALQPAQRLAQLRRAGCGRRAGRSRGRAAARFRSWQTRLGQVQHDRDRQARGTAWRARPAGFGPRAARWWRRPPSAAAARAACAAMKCSTSNASLGRGLVVLVVGDQAAAEVRREDLGRQEVRAGERDLAGAAGADQDDEARGSIGRSVASAHRREHRHLRRRPDLGSSGADRQEADA